MFAGFIFGLISGGINSTGAIWGVSDSWPTTEMQSRCVECFLFLCFVKLMRCCIDKNVLILLTVSSYFLVFQSVEYCIRQLLI